MGSTSNYIYQQYKGVWREIDHNDFNRLAVCPDLQDKVNQKDRDVTPLFLACIRKNHTIVEFLLQNGADPNIECKNCTPLYLACLYAETETVQALLTYGAAVNVLCTLRKVAPIHLAASKGTMDIADLLVKYGANVSIQSPKYGTALHVAVAKNHQYMTTFLLNQNVSIGGSNGDGDTPLHIASRMGFVEIVRMLLEKNANPTMKDQDGNTCLHLACQNNRETVSLLLINKYPDLIYMRNNTDRQTPLFYASDNIRRAMKRAFTSKMPGFSHAVNNKDFSDIKFSVQNKTFFGHRIILQFRCPNLLSNQKMVTINDVEAAVFHAFLTYLYTDSIDSVDKSLLPKLVGCADKFKVTRLKKICLDLTTTTTVDVPESTFQIDMQHAINNPEYSDVTLLVEGKLVHCHKVILSQHEYFRAMFSQTLKESQQKEISMSIPYSVFQVLLSYTYTWEMKELQPDTVVEVFLATDQFMIEGLRHGCEAYLCTCISKDNVLDLFHLSDTLKSLFLREECFDYIITNYKHLAETDEFKSLSDDLRNEIVLYMENRAKRMQAKPLQSNTKNFSIL